MNFLQRLIGKAISRFRPEKIPEFAAEMYINFVQNAKTDFYKSVSQEIVLKIKKGKDVHLLLDIGTGPGFMLFEIARMKPDLALIGIDMCGRLLKFAEEEKYRQNCSHISFMKCDANRINLKNDSCDFVVSSGVLHSLKQPVEAIKEWLRVLKPGCDLWIYDPAVLIESGDVEQYKLKKRFRNMGKCLTSRKDRFFFRLMYAISDLPPKPMKLRKIEKILKDTRIPHLFQVENRGTYVKIEIIKMSSYRTPPRRGS